jgi:Flp pilus assembly pilin Flp
MSPWVESSSCIIDCPHNPGQTCQQNHIVAGSICFVTKSWLQREQGQEVVEYAVLLLFISLLVLVGVMAFGPQLGIAYNGLAARVQAGL